MFHTWVYRVFMGIHGYTGYTWVYRVHMGIQGIQGIHGYTGYTNGHGRHLLQASTHILGKKQYFLVAVVHTWNKTWPRKKKEDFEMCCEDFEMCCEDFRICSEFKMCFEKFGMCFEEFGMCCA